MKLLRWESITAASTLIICMLSGCDANKSAESLCTDPLHDSLVALSVQSAASSLKNLEEAPLDNSANSRTSQTVDAKTLAYCTTEAIGKLDGYREKQLLNGDEISSSRININPLRVHITRAHPEAGDIEEVIMVESFTFAKIDGKWIEATEDNPKPAVKALLNLPKSFQTQFNPKLRAAGTSDSVVYSVEGTDTVLNQPVLILSAVITNNLETFTSKYFINSDYLVLRSQIIRTDGKVTTSEMTAIGDREDITNPILAKHDATNNDAK